MLPEKNNVDLGVNIADDLEDLKKNLDMYKVVISLCPGDKTRSPIYHCHDYNLQASSKGGGEFADVDVQQLDWVEDNRKVVMGMLTLQFMDITLSY